MRRNVRFTDHRLDSRSRSDASLATLSAVPRDTGTGTGPGTGTDPVPVRSEPATVWDLAVALAVRTTDLPPDEVDVQVVQQAEVGIIHVHLPKLQAADLVESGGDGVSLTEHAETLPLFTPAYRGVVRPVGDEEERREP